MLKSRYLIFLVLVGPVSFAQDDIQDCIANQYQHGDSSLTLLEMREICQSVPDGKKPTSNSDTPDNSAPTDGPQQWGLISERGLKEARTEFDRYVITPHKINYILPVVTTNAINKEAYRTFNGYEENLEDLEAKFQLSFKVPLNPRTMFVEGDALYFGFTLQAWWQIYADNISKPFRETNYQPEIYYFAPLDWHPFGGNTGYTVGIEHQSNGRAQDLSRSWNRIYTQLLFEKGDFALSFRPWYRLEEDEKEFPFDPDGDDNPDIEDYMGHFELGMVYKWDNFQLGLGGRRNFSTDKGAIELGLTFPLWGKLRGYATAFNGYGDSLIDYDYKQTRFGIGIALNDLI